MRIEKNIRTTRGAPAAGLPILAALLLASAPAAAQDTPAVATPPTLGPPPELKLPAVQEARLSNGLRIQLVEMHALPIVQATLSIEGGARLDRDRPGLATFTAGMLTEGAGGRDAFELSAEADYLGASLSASASWDATHVTLGSPKRTFAQALDLMADVVLRPSFNSEDIARQRDLRIAGLLQQRDQPAAVASLVFSRVVYPAGHPYHNPIGGDSSSIAAFDSALVRDYWNRTADPRRATLIVTGDITLEEARSLAEEKFGAWRAPERPLIDELPAAPKVEPARGTRVVLVDKPGAAQSMIIIGGPGVERTSPDYPAITLMNSILGGSFSSRLNDILREQKGYTYGAGSWFTWRPVPGPFAATSAVRTDVTDSSLAIFFREFETIRTTDVTRDELERAISYLTLGTLGDYETTRQVNNEINSLNSFGLPITTITDELEAIARLTPAEVRQAAQRYIVPEEMAVVVVGDLERIRPGIEALGLGPITIYDDQGRPVEASAQGN